MLQNYSISTVYLFTSTDCQRTKLTTLAAVSMEDLKTSYVTELCYKYSMLVHLNRLPENKVKHY